MGADTLLIALFLIKTVSSDILLIYDRLRLSPFFKSVAILTGGTALVRVIPVLISPILTRLYTPADFGTFALFMALVSPIIPAICGKYEIAMMLPKNNEQGRHLLGISFTIASGISLLCFFAIVLFRDDLLKLLDTPQLGAWIFFVPITLFLSGLMTGMKYFAIRHEDYRGIVNGMMFNSLSIAIAGIVFGFFGVGFPGLLTGSVVGVGSTSAYMLYRYRKELSSDLLIWRKSKTKLLKQYMDYPLYNASPGLLNGMTLALPIFFLSRYFSEVVVGYFSLMVRVIDTPLSFVSTPVSEVYMKKVVDLVNEKADVRPYLIKITIGLSAIVLFPTIFLILFAPTIFSFVFDEDWRQAGIYLQILMPALAVRFVASTLATTLGATRNNQLGAIWKFTGFIVTSAVFGFFAPQGDVIILFKAFVVMDIALYLLYYFFTWKAAGNPRN